MSFKCVSLPETIVPKHSMVHHHFPIEIGIFGILGGMPILDILVTASPEKKIPFYSIPIRWPFEDILGNYSCILFVLTYLYAVMISKNCPSLSDKFPCMDDVPMKNPNETHNFYPHESLCS
jgi:hypothetical protein